MRAHGRLIAATAVVALALLVRAGAAMRAESLWRDEANDVFLCRNAHSVGDLLRTLRTEGSPPLRFAVECAVHRGWPASVGPARAMVVAFGTAADAAVIAIAWQAFGPDAGFVAGLLMATCPYFVRYSVELRGYSQFQFLAALYAWALLRLMRRSNEDSRIDRSWSLGGLRRGFVTRGALAAGVVGAALALTHYYGLLLVAAATAVALALSRDRRERQRQLVAGGAVAALLVAPWIVVFAAQVSPDLRPWSVPDRKGLDLVRSVILPLGRWGAVLCAVIALGWWARRKLSSHTPEPDARAEREAFVLLLGGALGGNVAGWLLQFVPGVNARLEPPYLAGLAVWAVPPIAAALVSLVGRGSLARGPATATDRSRRVLQHAASFALLLGIGISQAADVRTWLRPRSPAPRIARAIARAGQPGDLILIVPPAHASSFNFYYDGDLEQWAPPFRARITNMPWAGLVARMEDAQVLAGFVDALADRLQRGGRVWVVSGGAGSLRLDTPDNDVGRAQQTAYARALVITRRELLRVLYRHAHQVPVAAEPALDYWEPMEAALFEPSSGRGVADARGTLR